MSEADKVDALAPDQGSVLDRLSNPDIFSGLVGSLLNTVEAFGAHVSGPGAAIAQLAFALLAILHPTPHTLKPPHGVASIPAPTAQ